MTSIAKHSALFAMLALLPLEGCLNSSYVDKPLVYVAIGNSLTSGVQNRGVRKDWQQHSYPALLAARMGVDFQQAYVDSPGIGALSTPTNPVTPMSMDAAGNISNGSPLANYQSLLSNKGAASYQNLGIPAIYSYDVSHASSTSTALDPTNVFFDIVLRSEGTQLHQAVAQNPDIVTLWIGINDIFLGVINGTVDTTKSIVPPVFPTATYKANMDRVFDSLLTKTHAKIFVANIPDLTSIPYVTTVPTVVVDSNFQPVAGGTIPVVTEEQNVQYVLLPALGYLQAGIGIPTAIGGTGTPLPAQLTLTQQEVATAQQLIKGYNTYLKSKAAASSGRVVFVDAASVLSNVVQGKIAGLTGVWQPIAMKMGVTTAFSLDGFHPNNRGYMEVANLFLDSINSAMGKKYAHYTP